MKNSFDNIMQNSKVHFIILVLLVLITYQNAFVGGFNIDDSIILNGIAEVNNSLSSLLLLFKKTYNNTDYRPITMISFGIEKILSNGVLNPNTSHAINIILLGICSFLLYIFILELPIHNKSNLKKVALFTCIIFIIHPIHSNVVCNIKSRDALLSATFSISTLYFILKFLNNNRKYYYILFSIVVFILAYLSKRDAYVLILIAPATYFLFYSKNYKKIILFFIILSILLIIVDNFSKSVISTNEIINGATQFHENPLADNDTTIARFSLFFTTILYYIKFHVIPTGYYYFFGYNQVPIKNLVSIINMLSLIIILLTLYVAFINFKKNKLITYGILFFYFGISFASNLPVLVADIIAPRLAFIASIGFALTIATAIILLEDRFNKKYGIIFIIVIIILYLPFSWHRNKLWMNENDLINHDTQYATNSFGTYRIASFFYLNESNHSIIQDEKINYADKCINASLRAIEIYPNYPAIYHNIASAYLVKKNKNLYKSYIYKALEIDSNLVNSWNIIAAYYQNNNEADSAIFYYKNALERYEIIKDNGDYNRTLENITLEYIKKGEYNIAVKLNESSIKKDSSNFIPYQNIGNIYLSKSDTSIALNYFYESFKKGLQNQELAKGIHDYYLRHNNLENATKFTSYMD